MKLMHAAGMVGLALVCLFAAAGAAEFTPEQDARFRALINELRCLVCQNQSIADSNAPLAADLRGQVQAQIEQGRSDAEIKAYLTARYGDFVLYQPPVKPSTALLWAGPFALLGGAVLAALVFLRRKRTPPAPPPLDEAAIQRLLKERP